MQARPARAAPRVALPLPLPLPARRPLIARVVIGGGVEGPALRLRMHAGPCSPLDRLGESRLATLERPSWVD